MVGGIPSNPGNAGQNTPVGGQEQETASALDIINSDKSVESSPWEFSFAKTMRENREAFGELMGDPALSKGFRGLAKDSFSSGGPQKSMATIRELLKNFRMDFDSTQTNFAKPAEGSPALGEHMADQRAKLIVSFDLDDNLVDSSHFMRNLSFELLTGDKYWPKVTAALGDISKNDFALMLQKEFLEDPSPFHGLPSLASKLADKLGFDSTNDVFNAKNFYNDLLGAYKQLARDVDKFGIVLGSPGFYDGLRQIRDDFADKGVDVIYILATNKETEAADPQIANMLAKGMIPSDLFDGMIGWADTGTLDTYNSDAAKAQRKPSADFIHNAVNVHRTEASVARAGYIDPSKQIVGFMHVGDSGGSDVGLSKAIKERHPGIESFATLTSTTTVAQGTEKLLKSAEEATNAGVHVQVTSTHNSEINQQLRNMGVNVADEPSDFTHRLEPEAFPDGDVVSQKRVAGRIRQVADLLTNSEGWKQRVSEHPMFQLVSDAMTSPENWSKVQEAYPDIESPEQFEARLLDFVRDSITANNAPRLAAVDVPSEASSTLRMDNPAPADADTLTGAAGTDTLTGMPIDTTDVGDDPPQRS